MNSIIKKIVPSTEEMMEWVTEIFSHGIRRPGYPADYWIENWLKRHFENFGLNDVKLDPVPVKKWEAQDGTLKLWLVDNPKDVIEIPCFPIPYTSQAKAVEGELCLNSNKSSMQDKIVVAKVKMLKLPNLAIKGLLELDRYYDPENEFENLEQLLPLSLSLDQSMNLSLKANALGFIGILSNFPWNTEKYYAPYDAIERKISGAWISPDNGERILNLMEKGTVKAKLSCIGKISNVICHNITGVLPGMSDEWVIIGTHHDGPWSSAVEDASGVAMVLAQAKYWSQIPKEQRPFNLMFLMNCAHMAGAIGAQTFVNNNKKLFRKVITAIHLEHVARDVKTENGKLMPLDDPTVRWWFVSRIPPLEEITENAIVEEDLKCSIILPPDGFAPGSDKPPTDGAFYHPLGIPFISFLTAPPYLFDPADTLDKIHQESFEPLTRAVIRIIHALKDYTAESLRNQVLSKQERQKLRKQK